MASDERQPHSDRFIGEKEVRRRTDLSRVTRWRLERKGLFPKRYCISPGRVAWRESQISAWIEAK